MGTSLQRKTLIIELMESGNARPVTLAGAGLDAPPCGPVSPCVNVCKRIIPTHTTKTEAISIGIDIGGRDAINFYI